MTQTKNSLSNKFIRFWGKSCHMNTDSFWVRTVRNLAAHANKQRRSNSYLHANQSIGNNLPEVTSNIFTLSRNYHPVQRFMFGFPPFFREESSYSYINLLPSRNINYLNYVSPSATHKLFTFRCWNKQPSNIANMVELLGIKQMWIIHPQWRLTVPAIFVSS